MAEITAKLSTALADRYKIERHLGEGGMANVYLGEDLKRKVGLKKVLRPELAAVLGARATITIRRVVLGDSVHDETTAPMLRIVSCPLPTAKECA